MKQAPFIHLRGYEYDCMVKTMKHIAVIKRPPELSGRNSTPDGAITGNGDLAVILGNSPDGMRVFLSKTDVWHAVEKENDGGLRPIGYIDIPISKTLYENYHVEQRMDEGTLYCRFADSSDLLEIEIRVSANENSVLIELNGETVPSPALTAYDIGETTGKSGTFDCGGHEGVYRSFDDAECLYPTHVYAALRPLDTKRYYAFVATNHDSDDPSALVREKLTNITASRFDGLKIKHADYWSGFWSKSSFTLSDDELEKQWYASQYFLAVTARNNKFPPGLYGNFVTVEHPNWHSDYHLNYNYQAPFYAACSSNHPELTDCYLSPLEDFVPRGKSFAEKLGCNGILFPCGLGPKGYMTETAKGSKYEFERPFMGQKSDAVHAADIAVFRWKTTLDLDYAREHAYPYLRECIEFFADYATMENGRYSICDDAIHEVPYYRDDFDEAKCREVHDKNNVLTLGLLRLCIPAAIEMAEKLDIDKDLREKWQDLLTRLSGFPTYIRRGRRVFRYTEKGMAWNDSNDVGQQHIFPCGCIGLSSPAAELKIARNTVNQRKYCFLDGNAVSSFYAIAARIGYDPAYMTDKLREFNRRTTLPNYLHNEGGGGLEYCAVNANALNEMALQSHQGMIRIFPDWDKRLNCEYERLRAEGAFLVSASINNGKVGHAKIEALMGGKLKVCFPEEDIRVWMNETAVNISKVDLEKGIDTSPGDVLTIRSV